MELPSDLLRIVTEFSKPSLKIKKYCQMSDCHFNEMSELKERLKQDNIDSVLVAMDNYLEAYQWFKESTAISDKARARREASNDESWSFDDEDNWEDAEETSKKDLWYMKACCHDLYTAMRGTPHVFPDYDSWANPPLPSWLRRGPRNLSYVGKNSRMGILMLL